MPTRSSGRSSTRTSPRPRGPRRPTCASRTTPDCAVRPRVARPRRGRSGDGRAEHPRLADRRRRRPRGRAHDRRLTNERPGSAWPADRCGARPARRGRGYRGCDGRRPRPRPRRDDRDAAAARSRRHGRVRDRAGRSARCFSAVRADRRLAVGATSDAASGRVADADLGALVRGVRLVFLAAASFTAAAGVDPRRAAAARDRAGDRRRATSSRHRSCCSWRRRRGSR